MPPGAGAGAGIGTGAGMLGAGTGIGIGGTGGGIGIFGTGAGAGIVKIGSGRGVGKGKGACFGGFGLKRPPPKPLAGSPCDCTGDPLKSPKSGNPNPKNFILATYITSAFFGGTHSTSSKLRAHWFTIFHALV